MRVLSILPVLLLAFQSAGAASARLPRQKPVGPGALDVPTVPSTPPPAAPAILPPALLQNSTAAAGPSSDAGADQSTSTGDETADDDTDDSTDVVWSWAEDGAEYLDMKTLVLYSDPLSLMVRLHLLWCRPENLFRYSVSAWRELWIDR